MDLNLKEDLFLFRMMMSALPAKVQCSNEKTGQYKLNIPKTVAIKNYKFIQFQHKKKYQWLSADIDTRKTFPDYGHVLEACLKANLPLPTLVVKTTRGWHVHWYMDETLWKNNPLHVLWRDKIKEYLGEVLGADKHAAGFIMRNPFQHDYLFNINGVYTIDDFNKIYTLDQTKQDLYEIKTTLKGLNKKVKATKQKIDFTKVQEGTRNNTLLVYIRSFMFRNFEDLKVEEFLVEALRMNSLMPQPLSKKEVQTIVFSAYKFVSANYKPGFKKEGQEEYNRKVAKFKAHKTYLKILTNLYKMLQEDSVSLFKLVHEYYSFRKLAKLVGVCHKTIKKYLVQLKTDLVNLVKNKGKMLVDLVNYSFKVFMSGAKVAVFDIIKSKNTNNLGVLRC